jgi:hypothetical protein
MRPKTIEKYAVQFLEWYDKSGYSVDTYYNNVKMTSSLLWIEFLKTLDK